MVTPKRMMPLAATMTLLMLRSLMSLNKVIQTRRTPRSLAAMLTVGMLTRVLVMKSLAVMQAIRMQSLQMLVVIVGNPKKVAIPTMET